MKRRHSFGPMLRRRALGAVGQLGRDRQLPAAALAHAGDALVPAGDDLALAERERERLAPRPTTRRTRRSCSTPARRTASVTLSPFFAAGPLPLTMSSICSSSGGSSSGTVTVGFLVTSVLSGVAVAFGVGVAAVSPRRRRRSRRGRARGRARGEACDASQPRQGSGLRVRSARVTAATLPPGPAPGPAQHARLGDAPDPVHGALPQPLRRPLHGRHGPARGQVDLPHAARRDPRDVHRARRRPAPRRGRARARVHGRLALGAAARRPRAPVPAQADAPGLPRRAHARARGRDGGGGRARGRRLAPARALRAARAHAGADARDHPARGLRPRGRAPARRAARDAEAAARPRRLPAHAAAAVPPPPRPARRRGRASSTCASAPTS